MLDRVLSVSLSSKNLARRRVFESARYMPLAPRILAVPQQVNSPVALPQPALRDSDLPLGYFALVQDDPD